MINEDVLELSKSVITDAIVLCTHEIAIASKIEEERYWNERRSKYLKLLEESGELFNGRYS